MAKKYNNFRVGGSPSNVNEDYAVWTNDLLERVIASKTVIQPGKSTQGHKLIDSDVVYVITNGRGSMEVVEYMNSDEGHGSDPSYGVEHKDSYDLTAGDVVLVQSGDYCKVINLSEHDQLTYLEYLIEAVGENNISILSD
jgi:mannose-6-phosphate isomerase-like protein (cupin superfamily)